MFPDDFRCAQDVHSLSSAQWVVIPRLSPDPCTEGYLYEDLFMCKDGDIAPSEVTVPVPLYQAKAEFFRTLGHPARIRVLELLSERDHAVHELLAAIEIEPSNLSQQLAVLRRAGLVVQRREGGSVVYSVSVPDVRDLLVAARGILRSILSDQDTLRAELGPSRRRVR